MHRTAPGGVRLGIVSLVLIFIATLFIVWLVQPARAQGAPAPSVTVPSTAGAIAAMKTGGTTIIVRHGFTNSDESDTLPTDLSRCDAQRHLNDAGRGQAATTGVLLALNGVKVSEIVTSRYCRAIETGDRIRLGVNPDAVMSQTVDVTEGGPSASPNEAKRRIAALQAIAAKSVAGGTNVLVVTHKPNIVDAFGCAFTDYGEGELSVWRGVGGKAVLVGRLKNSDLAAAI